MSPRVPTRDILYLPAEKVLAILAPIYNPVEASSWGWREELSFFLPVFASLELPQMGARRRLWSGHEGCGHRDAASGVSLVLLSSVRIMSLPRVWCIPALLESRELERKKKSSTPTPPPAEESYQESKAEWLLSRWARGRMARGYSDSLFSRWCKSTG